MTDFHNYRTPKKGTTDWDVPLNENFNQIDRDVEIRDVESNRDNYTPKSNAKYLATDTGSVYIGDGSSWNLLGEIVPEESGSGSSSPLVIASTFSGSNLAEKLVNAVASLPDGRGTVLILPKPDGSAWDLGGTATFDPATLNGVHIDATRALIEYGGSDWAVELVPSSSDATWHQTQNGGMWITGGVWRASGNPAGWLRAQDITRSVIKPFHVKDFTNGSDATGISLENVEQWCENNTFGGVFQNVDIGFWAKPASVTGGSGTASFDATQIDNMTAAANVCSFRLHGKQQGCLFNNTVAMGGADGWNGYEMAGDFSGAVFLAPKAEGATWFSDTGGFIDTGITGDEPSIIGGELVIHRTDMRPAMNLQG